MAAPNPSSLSTEDRLRLAFTDLDLLDAEQAQQLTEKTKLNELGLKSLNIVELFMAIEDEFNIEVPDGSESKFKTFGDIVTFVDGCSAQQPS
ncbi:MAG: phosphopantetheine-binding protein [Patescibacteria group bacterium]